MYTNTSRSRIGKNTLDTLFERSSIDDFSCSSGIESRILQLKQQIAQITALRESRKHHIQQKVNILSKSVKDLKGQLEEKALHSTDLSNRIQKRLETLREIRAQNKHLRSEYVKTCASKALLEAKKKYETDCIATLKRDVQIKIELEKSSVDDARNLLGEGLADYQSNRSNGTRKKDQIELDKVLKDIKIKLNTLNLFHKQLKQKTKSYSNLLVDREKLDSNKNDHKFLSHTAIVTMTSKLAATR